MYIAVQLTVGGRMFTRFFLSPAIGAILMAAAAWH